MWTENWTDTQFNANDNHLQARVQLINECMWESGGNVQRAWDGIKKSPKIKAHVAIEIILI